MIKCSFIFRQNPRENGDEPLIDETRTREDDEIYDVIRQQGISHKLLIYKHTNLKTNYVNIDFPFLIEHNILK